MPIQIVSTNNRKSEGISAQHGLEVKSKLITQNPNSTSQKIESELKLSNQCRYQQQQISEPSFAQAFSFINSSEDLHSSPKQGTHAHHRSLALPPPVVIFTTTASFPAIASEIRLAADLDPSRRKLFVHSLGWDTATNFLDLAFFPFEPLDDVRLVIDKPDSIHGVNSVPTYLTHNLIHRLFFSNAQRLFEEITAKSMFTWNSIQLMYVESNIIIATIHNKMEVLCHFFYAKHESPNFTHQLLDKILRLTLELCNDIDFPSQSTFKDNGNLSFGSILLQAMVSPEAREGLEPCCKATSVLSYVLNDTVQCEERVLKIMLDFPIPSLGAPESLLHRIVKHLAFASSRKIIKVNDHSTRSSEALYIQPFILQLLITCAHARLAACDYRNGLDMVEVTFSIGIYGLYHMPIHHLITWVRRVLQTDGYISG